MEKLQYSIGEVSKILGESVTTVRYWTNYFSKWLKIPRGGRNDRKYTPDDLETMKFIRFEIRERQTHLDGVADKLKSRKVASPVEEAIARLEAIKKSLEEIRANL